MIVSWGRIVVFELHLVTVYGGGGGPSVCVGRKTSDIVEGMDTSNDGGENDVTPGSVSGMHMSPGIRCIR